MRTISKQQLDWRRDRVRELTIKGWTQREIASELMVAATMVNKDLQFMRKAAKENIQHYIDDYLPAEYQYCLETLNMIVKEMWNVRSKDNRELIQARTLIKECCAMRLDLLSSATIIDRAVKFVDRHKGLITEDNNNNDVTEPIEDTG